MSGIYSFMKINEREFKNGFLADNASIGIGRVEKHQIDKRTIEYLKSGVKLCDELEVGYKKKNGGGKAGIQIKDFDPIISFDTVLRTNIQKPSKKDEEKLIDDISFVRATLNDVITKQKIENPKDIEKCQEFFLQISNSSLARVQAGVERIERAFSIEGY